MTATSLVEARLSIDHTAALLAISDGLCKIGAARTGASAGQFSIFNFLLRCAEEPERRDEAGRPAYVTMMQAGIMRRRGWYCRYWLPRDELPGRELPGDGLPSDELPLRIEVPAPMAIRWEWWVDLEEIQRRLERSPAWAETVGDPIEARIAHFRNALQAAELVRPSQS